MARTYSMNPEPIRWWLAAPVFALFVAIVPIPAWIVDDFYSRDMYSWLQGVMTATTNVLPFALLDVILLGIALAVLRRTYKLFHVARQRGIMDALWEAVRRMLRAAAVIFILFLWAWGFNYRRLPLDTAVPGGATQPTVDALAAALSDSGALASRLRPLVEPEGRFHSIALELREPMNTALLMLSREPLRTAGEPKFSLILSPFFAWSGVTGMTNPFGLETIVLPTLLPIERPFVIAHEWAHLAGHADEAEANAVGWLACMKGSPSAAYSASLYLIMEAGHALSQEVVTNLVAKLDPGVREDLDTIAQRMQQQQRPDVRRTAFRVYDEYLKANRVADGSASYGRALELILSPRFRDALAGYTISR
jgi:hypothetical protein